MTRYLLAIAICFSTLFFSACRNGQQTANQATDSLATAGEGAPSSTADIPVGSRLAELGLTPNSNWRGINLGDAFTNITAVEKGEPFESDAEHVGYTVELKNLETADVLYYQTDKKVSAIDVDLFLNSRQSVADYQKELNDYFSARYGSSKTAEGGTVWAGTKGEVVALKDVSKGKDFGLKIKIALAKGNITASAK